MKKRILSIILVMVMTLGFLPTLPIASAATYGTCGDNLTWSFDESIGTLTIDGIGEMYDNVEWPDRASVRNVIIQSGVTSIGNGAFAYCENLESIILPSTIEKIGLWAFGACSNLKTINLPDSVKIIEESAFTQCTSLITIKLPNSINEISDGLFLECSNLNTIIIPDKVVSIGSQAFAGTAIKTIELPDTINEIGFSAFEGCTKLENISLPNGIKTIPSNLFSFTEELKSIELPDSIENIESWAFYMCKGLETITIPKNVEMIGDEAFSNCNLLASITFNGKAPNIDSSAFIGVSATAYYPSCDSSWTSEKKNNYYGNLEWKSYFTDHQYIVKTNPSTCLEIGYTEHTCYCGDKYFDNYVSRLDHQYDNACDTSCNICGATRTTTHTFGDYVYDGNASEKADGTKTRTCSVCGHKETVTATGTKWQSSFTDIKAKDFYYKPTLWAVANDITTGTSKTTFSPNDACTRGQIVTFLWRAAGCPEPTTTTMPFTDVKNNAFYRKAVLWAVENGITSGTSKTTFSPNDPCTRGQIATFLWRASGKPAPTSTNMPFNDVAKKDFYYKAVLWAVENGITSGTSKTTFAPSEPCTRGQIVTFLYRAYN